MNLQLDFDIHTRENNSFSETILAAQRKRLIKSAIKVLDLLLKGNRLTVKGAVIEYDISSLPRRIADIDIFFSKQLGYEFTVEETPLPGGRIEWYLTERQIVIIEQILNP